MACLGAPLFSVCDTLFISPKISGGGFVTVLEEVSTLSVPVQVIYRWEALKD